LPFKCQVHLHKYRGVTWIKKLKINKEEDKVFEEAKKFVEEHIDAFKDWLMDLTQIWKNPKKLIKT